MYEQYRAAAKRVSDALLLPDIPAGNEMFSDGQCFVPWDLFPAVYGTYSSEFDYMAIEVLSDIIDRTYHRTDIAGEMFREMLCTADLCDYGTSPRVCFATTEFAALLPTLVERWKVYADLRWR